MIGLVLTCLIYFILGRNLEYTGILFLLIAFCNSSFRSLLSKFFLKRECILITSSNIFLGNSSFKEEILNGSSNKASENKFFI